MRADQGYFAAPRGGGPGVLVLHAWWGLSDGIMRYCDRLAAGGLVAHAPDLAGGRIARTIPEAQALADELDEEAGCRRAADGFARLRGHPAVRGRLAVAGFSMGVWFALDLATRFESVRTVVLHYGTAGPFDHSRHRAAVLGHFAEHDPYEPAEEVRALEDGLGRAGRAARFHVYPGVGHWFAEADRHDAYDAAAAARALRRTVSFLRDRLQTSAVAPPEEW